MPERKPRTKAPKGEQLDKVLQGELALYEKVGLFQRSLTPDSAYRYKGTLLEYQEALESKPPSLELSKIFLAHLRKQGYSPSTLRVARAALQGFHQWRGEKLEFPVKVPDHKPAYFEESIVSKMLKLARDIPRDFLVLLLLSQAGLRREESVELEVGNVGEKALRIRGKEDKDRTIPMTQTLLAAIKPFCEGKSPRDPVLGIKEKAIYETVKKYGRLVGRSDITPHSLRHAFATRLLEKGANLIEVQQLMGHDDVSTTQDYIAVTGSHLEHAISRLDDQVGTSIKKLTPEYGENAHTQKIRELARKLAERIYLPSLWDKGLWRDLPADFQPGNYYLPIGAVQISEDTQIKVNYYDIRADFAEPHLIKGLSSHLSTSELSKFSELVSGNSRLDEFIAEAGKYSLQLLIFLKLIADEVKRYEAGVNYHNELAPGLTQWFIVTIWKDAIDKASGSPWIPDSWYQPPEEIPSTGLIKLNCGGNIIGIAESEKTLKTYEKLHKQLRVKYTKHRSAKEISAKNIELGNLAQEIAGRLKEFSDISRLPGLCDLC